MSKLILTELFNTTASQLSSNEQYGFSIQHMLLEEHKCQLVFTDGLSDFDQEANGASASFKHIELVMVLPDYFKLTAESWPVYWLNRLAEVPNKYDTWFGHGDTIPAGKPPQPISEKLRADHFILSYPIHLSKQFPDPGTTSPAYLSVIPIFQKELSFKLSTSGTALLMKLKGKGYSDRIDEFRTSTCRKRILGLF